MQRIKELGCTSHFLAQRRQLLAFLGKEMPKHAAVVRVFDDTNVWLAPDGRAANGDLGEAGAQQERARNGNGNGNSENENDNGERELKSGSGKQGKRKVSTLMGLIQRVFIRRQGAEEGKAPLDLAQVHVPSQILPKAARSLHII